MVGLTGSHATAAAAVASERPLTAARPRSLLDHVLVITNIIIVRVERPTTAVGRRRRRCGRWIASR